MHNTRRLTTGLVVGCLGAIAGAALGFAVLRVAWPAYAAAETDKAYDFAMLVSRLSLGALCTTAGACVATTISGGHPRAAWWLGGVFVVASLPSHLYYSWLDYPLSYHAVYLGYLLPIAVVTGRVVRAQQSRAWCSTFAA